MESDKPTGQDRLAAYISSAVDKHLEAKKHSSHDWVQKHIGWFVLAALIMVIIALFLIMNTWPSAQAPSVLSSNSSSSAIAPKRVMLDTSLTSAESKLGALTALLVTEDGLITSVEKDAIDAFFQSRYQADPSHPANAIPDLVQQGQAPKEIFPPQVLMDKYWGFVYLLWPQDHALNALIDTSDWPYAQTHLEAGLLPPDALREYHEQLRHILINQVIDSIDSKEKAKMVTDYLSSWAAYHQARSAVSEFRGQGDSPDHDQWMAEIELSAVFDKTMATFNFRLFNKFNK